MGTQDNKINIYVHKILIKESSSTKIFEVPDVPFLRKTLLSNQRVS